MTIALIIVGVWFAVSAPLGLLLGGAMRLCEARSAANLPRTLSSVTPRSTARATTTARTLEHAA